MMKPMLLIAAFVLASCGPPAGDTQPAETQNVEAPADLAPPALPEVDPALLAAPSSDFTAIEPSEVGVQGAATLDEALAPLTVDAHAGEGAGELYVSRRESGEDAVADIVRTGLADDSIAAAHLRIEFRREPEGWFPTNAYRRMQCRRGALAEQWSASPCP